MKETVLKVQAVKEMAMELVYRGMVQQRVDCSSSCSWLKSTAKNLKLNLPEIHSNELQQVFC